MQAKSMKKKTNHSISEKLTETPRYKTSKGFSLTGQYQTRDCREYRVTMAEELRNLPIQGDYVTPPP